MPFSYCLEWNMNIYPCPATSKTRELLMVTHYSVVLEHLIGQVIPSYSGPKEPWSRVLARYFAPWFMHKLLDPRTYDAPLIHRFGSYSLVSDNLMMIALMPVHQRKLYAEMFSQPLLMRYMGRGVTYSEEEYADLCLRFARQNLNPMLDRHTGRLAQFTWAILTKEGIAGKYYLFNAEGRAELGFCISSTQQGRGLARQASDLIVNYLGEQTQFIATVHPRNRASAKTIEQIRYPDRTLVFFKDPALFVPNKYGENQSRECYVSKNRTRFSFFSYPRGREVHLDTANSLSHPP